MDLFIMGCLGLGDAILMKGAVVELSKEYEKVYYPSYVSNGPSIAFLFSDLPNVLVEEIYGPNEIYSLERHHISQGNKVIKLGMYTGERQIEPETFDMTFYRQAGVDFSKRWDSFKLVYSHPSTFIVPSDTSIVFICDSEERGFRINDSRIKSDAVKFRPWKSQLIFDFMHFLLTASEIHCIDTSWIHLVESIPTKAKLFYHLYARNNGPYHQAKKRKPWKILT